MTSTPTTEPPLCEACQAQRVQYLLAQITELDREIDREMKLKPTIWKLLRFAYLKTQLQTRLMGAQLEQAKAAKAKVKQ